MTNEAARKDEDLNGANSLDEQWGDALNEQGSQEEKPAEPSSQTAEPSSQTAEPSPQTPEPVQEEAAPSAPKAEKPKVAAVKKMDAKPASFDALTEESSGAMGNLNMVLDIPITISVELGRTRMMVKELLQLGQGTVVELDKLAGEPMEILVNGRLIARGEAVVVNEKFGIKLTDIVSPSERITKLK